MESSNPVNVSETLEALIQVVDNSSIIIASCTSSPQTPTCDQSLIRNCKTSNHGPAISNMHVDTGNKDEVQLATTNDWLHRPTAAALHPLTDLDESKITTEMEKSNGFNNPDDVSSIVDGIHSNANISMLHQNLFHDTHSAILQSNSCAFQSPITLGLGSPKVDNFSISNVIGNYQHRNGISIHNTSSSNPLINNNNNNLINNVCIMNNGYCNNNNRGPLTFNNTSNDCNTLSMMGSGGLLMGNSIGATTTGSATLVCHNLGHNSGRCAGVTPPKKRSRSAPWTVTEMLTLIDAKREERERCYLYKASGVKLPAAEKWRIVAMHMESKDMGRSGSQCQDKWENMMKDYKAVREWQFVKPLTQGNPLGVIKNYFKDMTNKERKDACLPPQMDEIVFFSLHAIQNEKEEKKERARRKVSDQYRARVTEQCLNNALKDQHQQTLCINAKLRAAGETFIKDRAVNSQCYMKEYRDEHIKEQTHSVDHSSTIRECLGTTHESITKDRTHNGESFVHKDHEGVESTFNEKDHVDGRHLGNDLSSSVMHSLGGYHNSLHKDHPHEDHLCGNTNVLYKKAFQKIEAMKDLINQGTSGDALMNNHSTLPNLLPQQKLENSMSIEKIDIDRGDTNRDDLAEFTMDTSSDYGGKVRKKKKTMSSNGAEAEIADQQDGSGVGPVNLENPVVLDDFMNVINKEGSTLSFKEIIDCFMKVLERNGRQQETEFCNKIRDTSSLVQVLVVLADAVKAIAQRL